MSTAAANTPSVVVLAGRRVDAPDATPRFPLIYAGDVKLNVRDLLQRRKATALVCSAACGADLIALDVAGKLGIRRRIVLPFEPAKFRAESVIDRPGDWGALYDRVIAEVRAAGDLVVLQGVDQAPGGKNDPFTATNARLVQDALELSGQKGGTVDASRLVAAVVWEGKSRGAGDYTQEFADTAKARGIAVEQLLTI